MVGTSLEGVRPPVKWFLASIRFSVGIAVPLRPSWDRYVMALSETGEPFLPFHTLSK